MKWIIEDLSRALAQLKRWQTWLVIGLLGTFAGLTYLVADMAFRTDALMVYLHRTADSCREMTNGVIIFMFFGMIFFALTALLCIGEFQQYFEFKQRTAHYQASQSLLWGIGWCVAAIGISAAALVFFNEYCR